MFGLNVADKYASAVNKNSGLGEYSWVLSADHFLIMHLSSVIFSIIGLHSFAVSSM